MEQEEIKFNHTETPIGLLPLHIFYTTPTNFQKNRNVIKI